MRGSALKLVSEKFPHIAERLARQVQADEVLGDLCEDLEACASAADRLRACRESAGLRREYAALRLRLERELLRHVEECRTGAVRSARHKPASRQRRAPATPGRAAVRR